MHELPVTQSVLDIVLRHASGARVTDVHLVIGELSAIVGDSVQFYWDMIAQGTPAEGARLHFRRVEARLSCMSCAHVYRPESGQLTCPNCGGAGAKIVSGEEFFVEAIDVEPEITGDSRR